MITDSERCSSTLASLQVFFLIQVTDGPQRHASSIYLQTFPLFNLATNKGTDQRGRWKRGFQNPDPSNARAKKTFPPLYGHVAKFQGRCYSGWLISQSKTCSMTNVDVLRFIMHLSRPRNHLKAMRGSKGRLSSNGISQIWSKSGRFPQRRTTKKNCARHKRTNNHTYNAKETRFLIPTSKSTTMTISFNTTGCQVIRTILFSQAF